MNYGTTRTLGELVLLSWDALVRDVQSWRDAGYTRVVPVAVRRCTCLEEGTAGTGGRFCKQLKLAMNCTMAAPLSNFDARVATDLFEDGGSSFFENISSSCRTIDC